MAHMVQVVKALAADLADRKSGSYNCKILIQARSVRVLKRERGTMRARMTPAGKARRTGHSLPPAKKKRQ